MSNEGCSLSVLLDFSAYNALNLLALLSSHSPTHTEWHEVSDSHLHHCFAQIANSLPFIPFDLIACTDPSCAQHHSPLDQLCFSFFDCIY